MKNKNTIMLGVTFLSILALSSCNNKNISSSSIDQSSSSSSSSIFSSESLSSSSSSSIRINDPVFSQNHYSYDKNISEDLELPLNLYGCNIYLVEINDNQLLSKYFYYDSITSCLVIKMEYLCTLENGNYKIKVIIDEEDVAPAETTLEITNSILTEFDEIRTKTYRFGKDTGVSFNCDFASASIVSLLKDDITIDESFYHYQNNALTISSELLDHCYGTADFKIMLSNHDSYEFSIKTDILFFTDYDITTIDDKTESIGGGNSLYQYATSEKQTIVDATSFNMHGNALKYIPNYENVDLDCHGIMTLGAENSGMTWYDVGYHKNSKYMISFDYLTHDTKVNNEQTFCFATVSGWGAPFVYQQDLLIGPENDDTVHHFSKILTGEQISNGTLIYAKWINGSGYLLLDNMRIIEISDEPHLNESYEYEYGSTNDLTIEFDTHDWIYELYIDDTKVEDLPMTSQGITLNFDYLNNLGVGMHILTLKTAIASYNTQLKIVDNRQAALIDTNANYTSGKDTQIILNASISDGIYIDSIYQKDKEDVLDTSYQSDGWKFTKIDTKFDYKDLVTLQVGLDGTGKLILSKDFLERISNTSTFEIAFNNGKTSIFTVSSNKLVVSNYDDTTLWGYLNGEEQFGNPFASGMNGAEYEIKERIPGNKALYIEDTSATNDSCYFTIRTLSHPFLWYTIDGDSEHLYREQFTYQISDITDVFLRILVPTGFDVENNFFGEYDEVVSTGGWDEVRYNLICDGQVHSLDTGWFSVGEDINTDFRLLQVSIPKFAKSENRFVMFDDFSYSKTKKENIDIKYKLNQSEDVVLDLSYPIENIYLDDTPLSFATVSDNKVKLNKESLNALTLGQHILKIKTTVGFFKGKITISSSGEATLNETYKEFNRGDNTLSLEGTFNNVNIVEVKKYPSANYDINKNNGLLLDNSHFTIESDKLIITKEVLDNLYGSTLFTIVMSNGENLSFTLKSNVLFYDNFNDPDIWIYGNPGNCEICQDTNMTSFETDENGQKHLVYQPKNAVLGHANFAGTHQNGVLSFKPNDGVGIGWTSLNMDPNKTYVLTLNYQVTGGNENAHFRFYRWFASGDVIDDKTYDVSHSQKTFTIEIGGSELNGFYFFCSYSDFSDIDDLKIDIYSISIVEKTNV